MRSAPRPVVVKQSSGAFGFLFAIVLAALVGVIVYVMMDKQGQGGGEVVQTPPEEATPKEVKPKPAPLPVASVEPADEPAPEGIPVYSKVLQPVFEAKCVGCHGTEKAKGRLAMHTYEKLMAGSGNGSIVTADEDDANRIEMIFRAELPEADEEHMPPQGKPQLTADELAILKWWIGGRRARRHRQQRGTRRNPQKTPGACGTLARLSSRETPLIPLAGKPDPRRCGARPAAINVKPARRRFASLPP